MKVAFIYVDAGKGHYVPAKALYDHYIEMGNEGVLENLFLLINAKRWNNSIKSWWRANLHHPNAERFLNELMDGPFVEKLIQFFAKTCISPYKAFVSWYEKEQPDYIICTNFLAHPVLTTFIKRAKIDIPIFEYVADVFSNQKIGASNQITRYFVASELGKMNIANDGVDEERIIVSPFPLKNDVMVFGDISKASARENLSLNPDKFTIILNFGGEGIGNVRLIEKILEKKLDWQIIILGDFSKLTELKYNEFRRRHPDLKLITPGYVNNIGLYIKACDVQIGKTGANSLLESLYLKRPFLMSELLYTSKAFIDFMKIKNIGWAEGDINKQIEILQKYETDDKYRKIFEDDLNSLPIKFGCIPFLQRADEEFKEYKNIRNKDIINY